ncbi:MAG: hypothetical protein ALECFALPRED_002642 [Alectoria fallacina]|uniref:Uncharacterized protein n=1 Tax=Alectoria fallacina TaxID=1903189 RepID=A0A8H3EGI1_9LECA|nr:MAG: hypothetical protein ALECFALPRED_002642 [Alectoria fallacina]
MLLTALNLSLVEMEDRGLWNCLGFAKPSLRLSSAPQRPALPTYPLIITRTHRTPSQILATSRIRRRRDEADMARKAAAQKLELDHEVRLLEVRQQYAAGSLSFNTTPSSVLYPPYDPNGPLEIPDMVLMKESLPVHAAAVVGKQRGRDGDGEIKREKEINYEVID